MRERGPPGFPGFATVNSSVISSRVNCSVYLDFLRPGLFGYLPQERVRNHRHIAAKNLLSQHCRQNVARGSVPEISDDTEKIKKVK